MMNDTPFLADCLATFRGLSDALKLAVLFLPPGFMLGILALALHHRRALRRLSLEALPDVLEDIEGRERLRQRLRAAADLALFEAIDALHEADDRAGDSRTP